MSYIAKADFSINDKKTRVQYKDSRQDVTGLIVNKKPNVKKEYWQKARLQCHRLFQTGTFVNKTSDGEEPGNINELEGQLNFIDQVDRSNRLRKKSPLNPKYTIKDHKKHTKALLSSREKTFSKFLFYRLFYNNEKPTILTEGHTDNIYLKSAINRLVNDYPNLGVPKSKNASYELLVRFIDYSKRTKFLLELAGGAPYLNHFINEYDKNHNFYNAPNPTHPVIVVLDNDKGLNDSGIEGLLKRIKQKVIYPKTLKDDEYRKSEFIHVMHNLYLVLTPLGNKDNQTDIEYFFGDDARKYIYKNKCFNSVDKRNEKTDLSKDAFANHIVKGKKNEINFNGLKPLLSRVNQAIEHFNLIKKK